MSGLHDYFAQSQRHVRSQQPTVHNTPENFKIAGVTREHTSSSKHAMQQAYQQVPFKPARATKAHGSKAKASTSAAASSQQAQQAPVLQSAHTSSQKSKKQLAQDYYLMQAFVQQPHQLVAGHPLTPNVLGLQKLQEKKAAEQYGTTQQSAHKRGKNSKKSETQQFMGTPDYSHQLRLTKSTKQMSTTSTQQAYYTYSQAAKHGKGSDMQSASQKRLGCPPLTEPSSSKRGGAHLTHSSANSVTGGGMGTPKTPHTANGFRRKWGGASSTKSQKSASSIKSTQYQQWTGNGKSTTTATDEFYQKSARGKKERSRPPSQSAKAPMKDVQAYETTGGFSSAADVQKAIRNLAWMAETQQMGALSSQQKGAKLQSQSSKQIKSVHQQQSQPASQYASHFQGKDQVNIGTRSSQTHANLASTIPPKPTTSAIPKPPNSAKRAACQTQKARSIPRNQAQMPVYQSQSTLSNHKILRPVLERNISHQNSLGLAGSGPTAGASSQQQAMVTRSIESGVGGASGSVMKSKKLKTLLQTGATQQSQKGADRASARGQSTPSRTDNRSRQRSYDAVIETQSLLTRRISQHSPSKRNRASNASSAHRQNNNNSNCQVRKQHMTPVMQSRDKLPSQGKNSQVGIAKGSHDGDAHNNQQSNKGLSYKYNASEQAAEVADGAEAANTAAEVKKLKSHRVQLSNAGENQPAFAQISRRNRHRSTSNKKRQTTLQVQSSQQNSHIGTQVNLNSASQTEQKKREAKRKKSTTRRGKSAKRQQPSQGLPPSADRRGRSPHQAALATAAAVEKSQERHQSPSGAGNMYSAFRLRALKPKNASREAPEIQARQGASISQERSKQIHVGLIPSKDRAGRDHQLLLQSASASNSICSQKTIRDGKTRGQTAAQKQKTMLTNIQNQVLAGSRALVANKKAKLETQASRKVVGHGDKKKHANNVEGEPKSHKIDLMKAQLIADIRIENRKAKQQQQQQQQDAQGSASQNSSIVIKSIKRTIEKPRKSIANKARSASSEERQNEEPQVIQVQQDSIGKQSPKIVLSLRQLEQLLLSTAGAPSSAKKQILYSSLKQFQQSESGKSRQANNSDAIFKKAAPQTHNIKPQKSQACSQDPQEHPQQNQLVTLQPTTLQVFNTISDTSSAVVTPNNMIHTKSNNSSQPQFNSMHESVQMRTQSQIGLITKFVNFQTTSIDDPKSQDQRELSQQQMIKASTKRMQDKISRQQKNLLTLVQGQKLRAQRMAATVQMTRPNAQATLQEEFEASDSPLAVTPSQENEFLDGRAVDDCWQDRPQSQEGDVQGNGVVSEHFSEAFSSSQRLQSLIYAKLESRQNSQHSQPQQNNAPEKMTPPQAQEHGSLEALQNGSFEKHRSPKKLKKFCIKRLDNSQDQPEKATYTERQIRTEGSVDNQPQLNLKERQNSQSSLANGQQSQLVPELREIVGKPQNNEVAPPEISMRSSSSSRSCRPNEESFLGRVALTGQTSKQHEQQQPLDEQNNTSNCSLKQPSLRQIGSSHTSRSNMQKQQRQESADTRKSHDPNASITLSRILLETSMQQSERGTGTNQQNKAYTSQGYTGHPTLAQKFQRLPNGELPSGANEHPQVGMLDQSQHTSGRNLSEINPAMQKSLHKHDSNDQLRSMMPRSLTNPDKLSNQNSTSKPRSAIQSYMVDEVWPTNSSHGRRTSSITSLTNSTPASRTLEQLQQQSITPQSFHPASPQQVTKSRLLPGRAQVATNAFEDPFMRAERLLQQSPLKESSSGAKQEEPYVQDQAADQREKNSRKSIDTSSNSRQPIDRSAICSSPKNQMKPYDEDAIASRGTSSPKRRRSPMKQHPHEKAIALIQPIQLDNSLADLDQDFQGTGMPTPIELDRKCTLLTRSFSNNEVDYSANEQRLSSSQNTNHARLEKEKNDPAMARLPQRDIIGRGDTAAVQHMMTRSEKGGDESYEDAPFEKSQNEGLNLIMFQGASSNANEVPQEEDSDVEEPESNQNLLSSINSQAENNSTPPSQIAQQQQQPSVVEPNPLTACPQTSDGTNPSQLAAIEDVLRLTPNTLEGIASLASVNTSYQIAGSTTHNERESVITQKPQGAESSPARDAPYERIEVESHRRHLLNAVSPMPSSSLGIRSEKLSPVPFRGDEVYEPLSQPKQAKTVNHLKEEDSSSPINPEQIGLRILPRRATSPADSDLSPPKANRVEHQICKNSAESMAPFDFEEADNTSQLLQSVQGENTQTEQKQPITVMPLKTPEPTPASGSGVLSSGSPRLGLGLGPVKPGEGGKAAGAQKYDIDSLNEIKKANDLASKKVEITNYIFEMLVGEIKGNMFPQRDDEDEVGNETNLQTGAKKKKKRKLQKRVKKPNVMPKIKEIKDGMPVETCLKRIQIAAKVRNSVCSGELLSSLSATQSLSLSKDTGRSYLDQTKSKEQLEISSQFHEIEQVKQEQMDLLQKKMAQSEEQQNLSKKLDADLKQLQTNLRGIKTTTDIVDSYLNNLFESLLACEQDFLEDLATPYALNPVQELLNIQVLSKQARKVIQAKSEQKMMLEEKKAQAQSSCDENLEMALFGFAQQQHPVLSVEIYLDIERQKDYVLLSDSISDLNMSIMSLSQSREREATPAPVDPSSENGTGEESTNQRTVKKQKKQVLVENQSMLAEWENIHNKVLFDAVNDALDEFRPYGLRGPPAPWSGQTRALTYRYSQNAKEVLQQVRDKVLGLSKTFGGALANSELLKEYHIRGPLEQDKLQMLREERLAIMMMQDVEDTQHKWEDLERQETGVKVELSEMILAQLTEEIVSELTAIQDGKF